MRRAQVVIKSPCEITRRLRGQAAIESPCGRQLAACRGQAAMEFLMTYGWAVLVILVVIAVLFYAGVFNTGSVVPKSCTFPSGFTCAEFEVDANGYLYLDVGQATGKSVNITGVGCGVPGNITWTSMNVLIRSGSHSNVTSSAGVACGGASAPAFKGSVILNYTVPGSGLASRSVTGSVSAPVTSFFSGGGDDEQVSDDTGIWILVPGNPSLGTSDFWVMKYEAKNNGSGTPVSTAAGNPWVSIIESDSDAACVLAGGHLLTVAEAQTINLDVAAQASNWMSGSVGTGCMYGGHMECNGAPCNTRFNASSDDNQGYWNGTSASWNTAVQHCPFDVTEDRGNETRRTFYLSNGQVIWDWSGNVWEWLNGSCQQGTGPDLWYNSGAWIQWTDANLQPPTHYELVTLGPSDASWDYNQGVGRYYGCSANGYAFMRGGDWTHSSHAGAFAALLGNAPSYTGADVGFRCAR